MPVSLDTKPREITADPLFVCALNRNATDDEQRCLWVQVGLAVSQTHFGTAFVLGGRQARPSTTWHACARLPDRYFLVCISTHKESKVKWPYAHVTGGGTQPNTGLVHAGNDDA